MSGGLKLNVALAGFPADLSRGAFLDSVFEADTSVPTFEFRPPPGEIMACGANWATVFSEGADVASYVSLLWLAYDRLVRPRMSAGRERVPSIVLMVERGLNPPAVLRLQPETTQEQMQEFVDHAEAICDLPEGPDAPELLWEFSRSEIWHEVHAAGRPGHS